MVSFVGFCPSRHGQVVVFSCPFCPAFDERYGKSVFWSILVNWTNFNQDRSLRTYGAMYTVDCTHSLRDNTFLTVDRERGVVYNYMPPERSPRGPEDSFFFTHQQKEFFSSGGFVFSCDTVFFALAHWETVEIYMKQKRAACNCAVVCIWLR